jgi:hypothetical protein
MIAGGVPLYGRHDVEVCRLQPARCHIAPVPQGLPSDSRDSEDGDRGLLGCARRIGFWELPLAGRMLMIIGAGWRGRFVWLKGFLLAVQGARSNKLW